MFSLNRKLLLVPATILGALAIAAPASAQSEGQMRITEGVDSSSGEAAALREAARKPDKGGKSKAGSRSLGDPLFPQIGNGGYDALKYSIAIDYDPAANSFAEGTRTRMRAKATQDLSRFSLDFQDDLTVSRVEVAGRKAKFKNVDARPVLSDNPAVTQPMKLLVNPKGFIRKGVRFKVEVFYSGDPEPIVDADESLEGWVPACSTDATCDGSFVVNEPIGAQSWFPSNNYATDKAKFKTAITVPSSHVALGAGELKTKRTSGNSVTWVWTEDDPTATFLTSATVGLFDYVESEMTEDSTGETLDVYTAIDSSGTPVSKAAVQTVFDLIPTQTNYLSEKLGPYPFDSTGGVADWAPNVGYALENQTKPHYDGNSLGPAVSDTTQLHELVHQWLGDSVSPRTWPDIWHSEGWATFLELYWDNDANGSGYSTADFFDDVYAAPEEEWTIAPAVLDGDPANLFAGFPVYERSAATIEGYRQILGSDGRFFRFAEKLVDRYGYSTIKTGQFIRQAKRHSRLEGAELRRLDRYFQQWLYGETKPKLTPADFE